MNLKPESINGKPLERRRLIFFFSQSRMPQVYKFTYFKQFFFKIQNFQYFFFFLRAIFLYYEAHWGRSLCM